MSDALITFQPRMLEPSKPSPSVKKIVAVFGERRSEMLPGAGQIGEFEVHELHAVIFNDFADVGWSFVFGHLFR